MITQPKVENRDAQHYMGIRTQVAMQELGSGIIPQLHSEVMGWLKSQGMEPSGAPFIRYHVINMATALDVELGWPVKTFTTGNGRVCGGTVPAGRYGVILYIGPYDGLMEANRVLIDWAKNTGVAWDVRESSRVMSSADGSKRISLIQATSRIQKNGKLKSRSSWRILSLYSPAPFPPQA
jgi:effector-binding domain-containing protein